MSSLPVRTTLKTALREWCLAQVPEVAFYDSINRLTKPTEDRWVTCSFYAYENSLMNTCGGREERGACEVIIFTRAGIGDAEGVALADAMCAHFDGLARSGILVMNVVPASEATSGDASAGVYGVQVALEYSRFKP